MKEMFRNRRRRYLGQFQEEEIVEFYQIIKRKKKNKHSTE